MVLNGENMGNKHADNDNKWGKMAQNEEGLPENEETLHTSASDNPAIDYASRDELEAQLNATEAKYNETVNKLQYLQAEFDNLRKRGERDISNAYKYGPEKLINELLLIVDSLEKSLEIMANEPHDPVTLREGVALTHKLLMNALEKFAVKQVNPVGEAFNPTWHEAMTMQESADAKPGTVLAVLQKGYTLHDRLLRPALVMVAK